MYFGSSKNLQVPNEEGLSKSESIVVRMLGNLLGRGSHVYTDNFYTSTRLLDYLWRRRTYLTGIINPLRGVPKVLRDFPCPLKSSYFMRFGHQLICKYSDRKVIYCITSKYLARVITVIKHWASRPWFFLPLPIHKYNLNMGGVDMADQKLKYYSNGRKSLCWFKKLAMHFIDRMGLNAFLIYRAQHPTYKKSYMQFITEVAGGLISHYRPGGSELIQAHVEKLLQMNVNRRRRGPSGLPRRLRDQSPPLAHADEDQAREDEARLRNTRLRSKATTTTPPPGRSRPPASPSSS